MRHPGEEVLYVIEGEVELYTEHYALVRLGLAIALISTEGLIPLNPV